MTGWLWGFAGLGGLQWDGLTRPERERSIGGVVTTSEEGSL